MSENFVDRTECPICESGSVVVDTVRTIDPGSDMELDIRECDACGHWWIDPLPRQDYLDSLYRSHSRHVIPEDYRPLDADAIRRAQHLPPRDYRRLQKLFPKRRPGTKCLEIGVGSGSVFHFLLSQGYECHGIDPGNWNPSIRLFDSVESLPYTDYGMFFLFDVLEHVQDPLKLLSDLRRRAAAGASIHARFPNKDSIPAKLLKGRWAMVLPLAHLHYFSKKSAERLLTSAGWTAKEIVPINAHHNRWFSSFDPIQIARKVLTPHKYWKDQLWVRGEAG